MAEFGEMGNSIEIKARNVSYDSFNGTNNPGYQSEAMDKKEVELSLSEKEENFGHEKLQRTMGYRQGFALMVGLILGSGIFISPGLVASNTTSTGMMLIIWVCAGFLGMMGALCYCELASIFKMAGSNYVNVLKIYGNVPAFLCAWTTCIVIDPSSIAAISLTIGLYLSKPFYPSDEAAQSVAKIIAFVVIMISLTVNCISVKVSNRVQSVFAFFQISSVSFVICLGIYEFAKEHRFENFHGMFNTTNVTMDAHMVIPVGIALFNALWSYDGWSQMSNAVEEMENMERNLLLVIMTGFPFVIFCYTLVNVSLLSLLNRVQMSVSKAVGVQFVTSALGQKAAYFMMILVAFSAYGTLNGTLFACPRLTLSAAREGHMPTFLSFINRKTKSPIPATCLTATIAILMLIPDMSQISTLILIFSQAQWLLYSASFFGVIVLRVRQPLIPRPFKIFIGIPIMMSLVGFTLIIIPFFRFPLLSAILFGFILAGIPVYFIFVHYHYSLPDGFVHLVDGISNKLQRYCGMVPCEVDNM